MAHCTTFYNNTIIFCFFLIYISKLSIQTIWLALEEQASHAVIFSGLVCHLLKGEIRFPKKRLCGRLLRCRFIVISNVLCYCKLCDNKQRKNTVEGKSHWALCELKGWIRKWQRRIPFQFSQVRISFLTDPGLNEFLILLQYFYTAFTPIDIVLSSYSSCYVCVFMKEFHSWFGWLTHDLIESDLCQSRPEKDCCWQLMFQ